MNRPERIGFQFPHERDAPFDQLLELARLADDSGYDALFVPEAWSREAFTTLGAIAAATRRIRIGPGIVNVYSRTPSLLAQSIATLDAASEGRAILGLGMSGPAVIENWHGMRYERGLRRTRETIEIVRLALSGARVDYEGEIFRLKGFRLGFRPVRERVPIFLAAMGPRNNRLVGEIADGWMPIWLPLGGFADALAEVGSIDEVAPNIMACVGEDRDRLRNMVRPHLAYYVGGMGTFYRDVVARFGLAEEAGRVHSLWQTGRRKDAVAAVTDGMVDQLAAVGDAASCRSRLAEYRALGATLPVIVVPHGAGQADFRRTLEGLA